MSNLGKAVIAAAAAGMVAFYLAAPAAADPSHNPCEHPVISVCSLLPVMPDLDHDIDLTTNPNGSQPIPATPANDQ